MTFNVLQIWFLDVLGAVFSPGRGVVGFPQENLRWHMKSVEDAQGHATSQTEFRNSTVK